MIGRRCQRDGRLDQQRVAADGDDRWGRQYGRAMVSAQGRYRLGPGEWVVFQRELSMDGRRPPATCTLRFEVLGAAPGRGTENRVLVRRDITLRD